MKRLQTVIAASLLFVLGSSELRAFNYQYNSSGNVEHWSFNPFDPLISTNVFDQGTHSVRYFLESDGWSATNTFNELNALKNCFGQWQSISNTVIKFEFAGLVAPGYDINTSDNTNVVYWAKSDIVNGGMSSLSGALALTFTSFSVPGNEIQQWDIAINGVDQGWFTDFNDQNNPDFFVEGTVAHEIGHSLGLAHANIGGATLLYDGSPGVDTQAGLSVDEIAFARSLYPASNTLSTLAGLKGTVTTNGGVPVFGAAVVVEATNGNLAGGTVTLTNGTYVLSALPPGAYNVRVVPLDPTSASGWLIQGPDISPAFSAANTTFLPTGNTPVTLTAGTTNTLNLTVVSANPAFRITFIRQTTSDSGSYAISGTPTFLSPGQSNYTIGVFSDSLPSSGATFSITGDGLTVGAPHYDAGDVFTGLNGISASISVSSNATPGLRSFTVTQGTNRAYANGFFEVLPLIPDYNFDGLDDRFQRQYFFPFTQASAAPNADPDGDGMNNTKEYIAGTNPTNAASLLKITSITRAANGATVSWLSVTNRHYQLMSRTNAAAGTWQNVGGVLTPTGATTSFLDTSGTNGLRVYRVEVLP
jgi:hypothetical protein